MLAVIRTVFYFGPLLFAIGFLVPLIAQSCVAAGWDQPFGLTPLAFGMILGGFLGIAAQIRGRWV